MLIKGDEKYEIWFAKVRHIPDWKKRDLRSKMDSAKSIYYIEEKELKERSDFTDRECELLEEARQNSDPDEELKRLKDKGISFYTEACNEYPQRLRGIASPPYAIYVNGELPNPQKPTVSIVGARECTAYGERMAIHFSERLAEEGVQIISGMARGIDGAGHRGALNVNGKTFAVLGCGVDVCYPKGNMGLYKDLEAKGGILSEYPVGCQPFKSHFPARNRIISALSDAVLVIEAREKSGSLITADMALEQGKDVYALPGPVTSHLSRGCHELIRQGAGILISPEDFLREKGWFFHESDQIAKSCKKEIKLERTENMLYSCLGLYPKNLDHLLEETGLEPQQLTRCLIAMEMKGYIKEVSKNHYVRR